MTSAIKKEEYDGRKDLVSKVLEISSLIIVIVLGLVTIGQITLEYSLRLVIMLSSIFLFLSICCGFSFFWLSQSHDFSKIENRDSPGNYGSKEWTYSSLKKTTWEKLTKISKSQIILFFLGMLFLLIALFWRLLSDCS